jgi:hypothetical protein
MAKEKYEGRCHCGRVTFTVNADLINDRNGICNCSNCTMRGFIHHHADKSDFCLITGFDDLKLYKFGTLSAEHYFCKYCGVESFYRSRSDPNMWDVNVRCLFKRDEKTGAPMKVDIYGLNYKLGDGEHWVESQTARRKAEKVGEKFAATPYALLAPVDDLKRRVNVADEFGKTWRPKGKQ